MLALEKVFFTPLYYPDSALSVVRWWEQRRLLFNAVVGGAGVLTLGVVSLMLGPPPPPVLGAVAFYGIMANVCYSLGSVTDLLLRRWLGDKAPAAGPVLFRYGFVFSVGLTLLPIPVVTVASVLKWIIN